MESEKSILSTRIFNNYFHCFQLKRVLTSVKHERGISSGLIHPRRGRRQNSEHLSFLRMRNISILVTLEPMSLL